MGVFSDLTEIPVFVKLGAMLPTVPLTVGASVGHASKQYHELEFTVYGLTAGADGSAVVYEDDGNTTAVRCSTFAPAFGLVLTSLLPVCAQYVNDAYAWTTAKYSTSGSSLTFSVTTTAAAGASDKTLSAAVPADRLYTLNIVNALPPTSVSVGGKQLPFSRYAGAGGVHPRGTW